MYQIIITGENESEEIKARGMSLLAAFAGLLNLLHEETVPENFDGLSDLMNCLADISGQMEDDDCEKAVSKHYDMDPYYSFIICCEKC